MAYTTSTIHEGNTILLRCHETGDYVFSVATSQSEGRLELHQRSEGDKIYHDDHFAAFQILSEPWDPFISSLKSPLIIPKHEPDDVSMDAIFTSTIYGRKIKLRQVATNMYLSVDSSSDSLKIVKKDDDSCLFKILPAQMETSNEKRRGDSISSGDRVIVESVKKKGYHILSCQKTESKRNNLKIAVTKSTFVIEILCNTKCHKAIREGSVIRLRDITVDGFLVGTACHTGKDTIAIRRKWNINGMKRHPPTSGNCLWQLEKVDSLQFNGNPVHFEDKCYIKHVPSKKYLLVYKWQQEYKLKLDSDHGSQFILSSKEKNDAAEVVNEKIVRLQYLPWGIDDSKVAKTFLTVQRDNTLPKHVDKKNHIGTKFLNVCLNKECDTANFRIEEVTPDHVHSLYFVTSIHHVLAEYSELVLCDPTYESDDLKAILDVLVKYINKNIKIGAKMLRVYHIVDMLVHILAKSQSVDIQKKVCLVLECYAKTTSHNLRLYLIKKGPDLNFRELFVKKLGRGLGVENVLSTLVYHDSKIADLLVSAIKPKKHKFVVHDAAVLHLYSSLCFTEGLPNRQLQDKVFTTVIKKGQDICYETKVISGEVYIFLPNEFEAPGQNQMSLEEHSIPVKKPVLVSSLACTSEEKDLCIVQLRLIAQLRLFSKVCKGVSETSIDELKKLKTESWFDEALIALRDKKIPLEIKSAYLNLVESLYIEPSINKNGRHIDHLWYCYLWENLVYPDSLKASNVSRYSVDTLEDGANIRTLISHIGKKVKNTKVLEPNKTHSADNELLAQMLEVMERLAAYAYFWDVSEIEFDFSSLVRILDTRTDNYPNNNQRYKKDNNEHIFKVKRIAVKLLHVFFKQLSYMACAKLLIEFKCRKDSTNPGLDPLLKESFNVSSLEIDVLDRQRQALARFFETRGDYKCFNVDDPGGLVVILQDLMSYEDDILRICSANLLYAIYKKEHRLFEDAKCSYIHTAIDQKDPTEHHSIYNWSLGEGALTKESELKTFVDATHPTELPKFIKKVKNLFLFVQNEVCPRPSYQNIVYTTGVYSALLIFVFKHFSKDYKNHPEKDQIKELLVEVCDVLKKLCRGNKLVQQKMFLHFTDFYDVKTGVSSVAYLLTEIITDNVTLCRDFSEGEIRQLYVLACTGETKEYLDFFTTLKAVMKPSKSKPGPLLKNYQEKIARMLNQSFHYKDYFIRLMLEDRLTILSKHNPNDDDKLLTLLNVSSLLATCAEGKGKFAEILFHKIFTVKELLSILGNDDVPRERKVPFAHLLNEACIHSEKYCHSSMHELKNSDFWKHIDDCTSFVNNDIVTLRDERYTEKFMFLFKRLFSEHISWTNVWKLDDDSSTKEISFSLFYFVDGVIPLVTAFCNELNSDELDEWQQDTIKKFGNTVLKLVDKNLAPIFLTCEAHVLFWDSCFNSISKLFPNEFKHKNAASKIEQTKYEYEKAETEIPDEQMNEHFQHFIINYQEAYEVNEQETQDSDDKSESSTQLLPGGRSFKCLVDLFTDVDSTKFKRNIKKASDMLGVLYNQLCHTYDSIKKDQLNADLCTTLQLLHGVLSQFTCSEMRLKEKIEDLEEIYQKTAYLLVHPSDDVAVLALYVILDLCKCNKDKTAKLVTASDENFFLRLYKLLSTAISWFSDDSSVQEVSGTHVKIRSQSEDLEEEEEEPGDSIIYCIESAGQLEITEKEAVQHVTVVLKLIITICDGQVTDMQNILRHQEHNISIDIVGEVTELLQTVVENKRPNLSVIILTIQALIEMCSGNHANQNVAINGQVVDIINQILKQPAPKWEDCSIQCKALELLEILLEETSSDPATCQDTGRVVAKDIDVSIILAKMAGFYIYKSADCDKEEIIDIATFRTYHILRKSADYLRKPLSEYVPTFNEKNVVGKYVKDSTCHIEVNYTDSIEETSSDKAILTSVYFRYVSEKLTEGQKTEIQDNINRDSLEEKAKDLLKWTNSVDKNLKYREKPKIKKISIIKKWSGPLRLFLNFLTILLNIIVLIAFRISDRSFTIGSNSSLFIVLYPETSIPYQFIYRLLGILHLILSLFMVINYFVFKYPNFTFKIHPLLMNLLYEAKLWLSQFEKFKDNKKLNWIDKPPKSQYFDINFWGVYTIYRLFFLACSILGLLFSGYFYCFCLPYIFIKSELLNHVVIAVQGKFVQLVLVILLILSIILIYAAISFAFISNFFNPVPGDNLFCQSLFECYITIIREGLLNGFRAIPTNRVGQEYPSFQVYLGRSFIDLTFFIIVSVIGLEVIAAILIDRFSELRTERDAAEKDKKDFCFICGIDSDQFEQCGISFEDHCNDDHNMYNYMYFIHHVKSKKPEDHNAIEKYVYDCVSSNPGSIKFLPLRKAKKLGGKVFTKDQNAQFVKMEKTILEEMKNLKAE